MNLVGKYLIVDKDGDWYDVEDNAFTTVVYPMTMKQARAAIKKIKAEDRREPDLNSGPYRIIKLVEVR